MAKVGFFQTITAGVFFFSCVAVGTAGSPTVEQILNSYKPRQAGIDISTPAADEYKDCKVKLVKGSQSGSTGWLLVDGQNRPLRRYFDANGDKKIDNWSYYKDGVEVYREIDANYNNRPEQFRWLNTAGMKWGLDYNEDGKIDAWKIISADEVAHEVFAACAERDAARLKALLISDSEMESISLPDAEVSRIKKLRANATAKLQQTLSEIPGLDSKAKFLRVESAVPQCVPAGQSGNSDDVFKFPSRAILFETADNKHDWLHTGEMIRIGDAWRLLDAPSHEPADITSGAGPNQIAKIDPKLQKYLDRLSEIDKDPPAPNYGAPPHPEVIKYNMERVQLIENILPLTKGEDREMWLKQIFDNLSAAAQAGSDTAFKRLTQYKDQMVKSMPKSALAAYGVYRHMWAEYAPKLAQSKNFPKTQNEWMERLAKYVQNYSNSDDTPDALLHLGMGNEFSGRDEEAKRWYQQLADNFKDHYLTDKARGAVRRLSMAGKKIELTGPKLQDGSAFNIASQKDKVVVVYYWASYCSSCVRDFATLNQLQSKYGSKGLEIVMINVDDRRETAAEYLQKHPIQAIHLFQAATEGGGLNSPLATRFGIMGLPAVFLVGRDGNVINRSIQVHDLENAIQKAL